MGKFFWISPWSQNEDLLKQQWQWQRALIEERYKGMARPKKQTVDYFSHDTDASQGRTVTALLNKYGNDGYAFWFMLLELLGRSPGHFYSFSDPGDWEFLLAKTHISAAETAKSILETLAILKAIDPELHKQGIIWSQNFVDRLADVYKKRKESKPERPNTVPKTHISAAEIKVSGGGNPQSKLNKIKSLPPKGGQHKALSTKDSVVNEIFAEMRAYLGYPNKISQDPIPSYGKEGQAIKRMLTRGFTREAIVECWKSKVSQRGGEFVSMVWVNQDIGQTGTRKTRRQLSSEEEIAASIKEAEK